MGRGIRPRPPAQDVGQGLALTRGHRLPSTPETPFSSPGPGWDPAPDPQSVPVGCLPVTTGTLEHRARGTWFKAHVLPRGTASPPALLLVFGGVNDSDLAPAQRSPCRFLAVSSQTSACPNTPPLAACPTVPSSSALRPALSARPHPVAPLSALECHPAGGHGCPWLRPGSRAQTLDHAEHGAGRGVIERGFVLRTRAPFLSRPPGRARPSS